MARKSISIADLFTLESSFATEFRRVLHNLTHSPRKEELKSILITSSTLSEGKSTICSLLAITAAKKGMKTLLVDCDLRRPTVHKLFKLERNRGISEVLTEGLTVKAIIKKTNIETLDIVTAGKQYAHPAEIFDSPAVGRLVEEAKFYYDLVLIDSPPIIPVSDPMLLAPEVDGVIIVVKAGDTQREVVTRAVDIIGSNSNKILGVIVNNVGNTLPFYYDYDYYGYRYDQRPERAAKTPTPAPAAPKTEPPTDKPSESGKTSSGKIPR